MAQNTGSKILLPVEVLGVEGTIEERKFTIHESQLENIDQFWLQVNNLSYQNKASIKINNQNWLDLNHNTTKIESPERERGGMVHGGYGTIRFTILAQGFVVGENTIQFRFNTSDGISSGFRVVKLNLINRNGSKILGDDYFLEDDPKTWKSPYKDAASIKAGKDLWYDASLKNNYLKVDKKGFWYGYKLKSQEPIKAKCASCHTQDGRDLEIFSYSNKSIIERAKFHQLTEEDGKLIASYIRSLSEEKENVGRYGRPWNPPYQPGPELEHKPIEEWAAGAGLEAVLQADKEMLPYMFPNGVNQETVYNRFDSDKMVDRTLLPIAIQFPDWKSWLPMIHPMDAYSKDDYWNHPLNQGGTAFFPKFGYQSFRAYLEAMPPANRNPEDLMKQNERFWRHYRFFLADGRPDRNLGEHWREPNGTATQHLGDGIPREFAATSLARLMAVQFFEIMNEFDLQDKAHWFAKEEDQPAKRQWFGTRYQVFEVPPHFQACVSEQELPINDGYNITGNCNNFFGQTEATGAYESTNWYHLQLIINGGNGMVSHNSPMDYNYHPGFIMKASKKSGIYEPLRYYHSLNAMYQFRSWSGATTPNNGKGFRIRVQGPWHIIGRTDSHQLNNFKASIWPTFLDNVKLGMSKWVLNAQLRQFLKEVKKPENSLDSWNRLPNGGSNELDFRSKKTLDLKEMSNFVGLHYWADKMYYLIPEFSKLGVACDIIEEMIDWSSNAWPNINWETFRNSGELQLNLLVNKEETCNIHPNKIIAQTANEGENPIYEWWVNGEKTANHQKEFDISNFRVGTTLTCKVTSSKNCISNSWVAKEFILPNESVTIRVRKNDENWQKLNNSIVCLNDSMEFKIEPELNEPLFWLDAKDIFSDGTKPTEGIKIGQWKNKSKSSFTMSQQSDINLKPTYSETGMNGLPTLLFGANNANGLELFPQNNDAVLNENWTLLVAGKYYRATAGDWNAILGNEKDNDGLGVYFSRKDGRHRVKFNGSNNHGGYYEDGSDFILMITKEGKKITTYINGKEEESFSGSGANMETSRAFYLGQSAGGISNSGWYHKGPISEVIFYDYNINKTQKEYLEGYLMHKWQFDKDLPASHNYKENSPTDIILENPNGEKFIFDNNISSHKIQFKNAQILGEYSFKKASCENSKLNFNIINSTILTDNFIKYSIDKDRFKTGGEIEITELSDLELLPNYTIKGDYQWEKPDGSLLLVNKDPEKFTVHLNDNLKVWKLHVLKDDSSCILNDTIYKVVLKVTENTLSLKENSLLSQIKMYPNPTIGLINIFIPKKNLLNVKATVYNTLRQKILSSTYNLSNGIMNLSLENIPAGIYFVRLELEEPIILKIVKE
ncbi:T9SS type A sorting domain-containing protein [uncultured Polaribacter sp.]|uniref:T9SS type A sorting domain-containing protein n=1 Tax=uncultured Polaribacter sp. TaxID=174711 RepID=UPI002633F0B3|nr:T9SS type A sorting domain-containing protein [uncultured Polaribacter sp.]